jgi:hypothetical protein
VNAVSGGYHPPSSLLEKLRTSSAWGPYVDRPRWLTYRLVQKKTSHRFDKVTSAKVNDPKMWRTLPEIVRLHGSEIAGGALRVGFVFCQDDGLVGGDLDDCVKDGVIAPWAQHILDQLRTYAEFSVTRTGIHVICSAATLPTPTGTHAGDVWFYSSHRFFAVTGDPVPGTPLAVEARGVELDCLFRELGVRTRRREAATAQGDVPAGELPDPDSARDQQLIQRALALTRFPDGDVVHGGRHHSQGDFRFCMNLARLTGGNLAYVMQLFEQSSRMTAKWNSPRGATTWGRLKAEEAIRWVRAQLQAAPPTPTSTPNGEIISEREPAQYLRRDPPLRFQSLADLAASWRFQSLAELVHVESASVDWIIAGLIAKGYATLLPGLWKAGKSTLISHYITAITTGTAFCEFSTTPGAITVVSEEPGLLWHQRLTHLSCGPDQLDFLIKPFPMGRLSPAQWMLFIDAVVTHTCGRALVIFDSLFNLWGVEHENDNAEVLRWIAPLDQILEAGPALLLAGHPSKADRAEGRLARGGGALAGWVSIITEFKRFSPQDPEDGRRLLQGFSRFRETPDEIVVNLVDGTYKREGTKAEVRAADRTDAMLVRRARLVALLPPLPPGLSAKEVTDRGVLGENSPTKRTIETDLADLYTRSYIDRTGTGKPPRDPFRYFQKGGEQGGIAQ